MDHSGSVVKAGTAGECIPIPDERKLRPGSHRVLIPFYRNVERYKSSFGEFFEEK